MVYTMVMIGGVARMSRPTFVNTRVDRKVNRYVHVSRDIERTMVKARPQWAPGMLIARAPAQLVFP